jgi:Sec-independent protein secretion pathway component TatC
VTQIMMAGSLIVLYLLSIALAWLVGRRAED